MGFMGTRFRFLESARRRARRFPAAAHLPGENHAFQLGTSNWTPYPATLVGARSQRRFRREDPDPDPPIVLEPAAATGR